MSVGSVSVLRQQHARHLLWKDTWLWCHSQLSSPRSCRTRAAISVCSLSLSRQGPGCRPVSQGLAQQAHLWEAKMSSQGSEGCMRTEQGPWDLLLGDCL